MSVLGKNEAHYEHVFSAFFPEVLQFCRNGGSGPPELLHRAYVYHAYSRAVSFCIVFTHVRNQPFPQCYAVDTGHLRNAARGRVLECRFVWAPHMTFHCPQCLTEFLLCCLCGSGVQYPGRTRIETRHRRLLTCRMLGLYSCLATHSKDTEDRLFVCFCEYRRRVRKCLIVKGFNPLKLGGNSMYHVV
jgi:hypothetical protein